MYNVLHSSANREIEHYIHGYIYIHVLSDILTSSLFPKYLFLTYPKSLPTLIPLDSCVLNIPI